MNPALDSTAALFKLLSEPVRLRILNLLTRGERCVCEIMAVLDLPQSTVSRHLGRLSRAGLVLDRRQGRWMYYRLPQAPEPDGDPHNEAQGVLDLLGRLAAGQPWAREDLDALERHLETSPPDRCR